MGTAVGKVSASAANSFITFLEMIPIALSVFLWDRVFKRKKIAFHVDNLAVVSVELEVIQISKSNAFVNTDQAIGIISKKVISFKISA
jgi:hypothetical protein